MQVSEIFYTLQGEGINLGQPAVFLRLAGCHLRCVWCDSKFTWNMKSGSTMSTAEIIKEIKKYPCKNLVITGGEPLIQQSAIKELIEKLNGKSKKYYIEIETSGSLKTHLNDYINHYNCSPKLSHSGNKKFTLEEFPAEKTWYKFVVDSKKDLTEIKKIMKDYKLPKERIILMPQGVEYKELSQKSQWLAEICKAENLRFSPRLHIYIWGNKRAT
ncbi:MAG: 7-carboxy-7-deazaguanine synthase QueE [Patescibacteria group bacterium]